jgi:hypothetical protein
LQDPFDDSSGVSGAVVPGAGRPAVGDGRRVIGYLERVAFPRWGAGTLTAKMDTGADTSALHVDELERVGSTRVSFRVPWEHGADVHPVLARIVRLGWVRSSNGDEEERIFVRTAVTLAGVSRTIEVGLCDRSRMQQRILLGRSALEGVYLIDPARTHLTETAPPAMPRTTEGLPEGRSRR